MRGPSEYYILRQNIITSIGIAILLLFTGTSCSFKKKSTDQDRTQKKVYNVISNDEPTKSSQEEINLEQIVLKSTLADLEASLSKYTPKELNEIKVSGKSLLDLAIESNDSSKITYLLAQGLHPDNCSEESFESTRYESAYNEIRNNYWQKVDTANFDQFNFPPIICERSIKEFFRNRYSDHPRTPIFFSDLKSILSSKTCNSKLPQFSAQQNAEWFTDEIFYYAQSLSSFHLYAFDERQLNLTPLILDFLNQLGPHANPTVNLKIKKETVRINPAVILFVAMITKETWDEHKVELASIISKFYSKDSDLGEDKDYAYDVNVLNDGERCTERRAGDFCIRQMRTIYACLAAGIDLAGLQCTMDFYR